MVPGGRTSYVDPCCFLLTEAEIGLGVGVGMYPVIHCHHPNYSVSRWAAERTRAETWPADIATESS